MPTVPALGRAAVFAGVVVFLLGQAFDTYWHARNVSFVPEPPRELWRIHLGIYLGAAMLTALGAWLLTRPGLRLAGLLMLLGGGTQLLGFGWDMYLHGQGRSKEIWHDLLWYGFGVVVLGVVRLEALIRRHPVAADMPKAV
ncbi:hypothetical protein JNW91_12355 [Micromonospora sp. STR1_7]|uniref:DUF4383 domain-containing protein n=1 Tax=Micromonospora parastrephiae TaxID=2806101 RepID=A0ABS1XTJ5_9ACTN|nr:hypothetical protein [Micromonospora parastrephiae]MBM0232585.1 hypothetical protein [Micromonospora parastrephiae]